MEQISLVESISNITSDVIVRLEEEYKQKVNQLSLLTLKKDLAQLSLVEVKSVLLLSMSFIPVEFTISAGSKRKTEIQYSTNDYHVSEKIDCSAYKDSLLAILDMTLSPEEMLKTYFRMKAAFYSYSQALLESNESFLRTCLRDYEAKDNIPGQGRFSSSR